jgi:hypothetical protein
MDVMKQFPAMVLSGVGLVSPAGTEKDDFFKYLTEGSLPDGRIADSEESEPGRLLTILNVIEPKLKMVRYLDPVSKNAIVALSGALRDAGIDERQISAAPHDYGIVLGTTRGPCLTREGLYDSFASRQGKAVSATLFSHCGYNIAGAMMAIAYGIQGPNVTVAARGDLGLAVLRRARQFLMSNRAHTVFAGFTECHGKFRRGSGPFGEFAYLLCLERKDRAVERGTSGLTEVNLLDVAGDTSGDPFEVVNDLGTRYDSFLDRTATLSRSLPGLQSFGDPYRSLFMIGLLSHEGGLGKRRHAFVAGAGRAGAKVELVHIKGEHAVV